MGRYLFPLSVFVASIGVWQTMTSVFQVPSYLLPSPSELLQELFSVDLWWVHATSTAVEALVGFLAGSAFAIGMAILFVHSQLARLSFYPYVIALKTVPIVAVAPLLILWLGSGIYSKAAIAMLICFFPTLVNSVRGLTAVDDEALDLFRSLGASRWQIFAKLRFPTALPYIFAALKVSSTLSVIGAIVGEFTGANRGVGFLILYSSRWLETGQVFAGILVASLIGMSFFGVLSALEKQLVYWAEPL